MTRRDPRESAELDSLRPDALELKRSDADDTAVQAELRFLVVLNMGAVGLAFMGLALALVAVIMG